MLILCRQKKKTLDFSVRFVFNPITSRGDYHAISPFGIHILSSKQVVRILKLISYKLLLDWTPIQFTRKCVTARGEIWQSDLGSWRVNWAIFFFFYRAMHQRGCTFTMQDQSLALKLLLLLILWLQLEWIVSNFFPFLFFLEMGQVVFSFIAICTTG